jgi:fructokinase
MTAKGVALVAGEALIDLIPAADGALHPHLGGGPFNAARTIGRLEQPVAFLGAVSRDRFGRELRLALERDGVDTTTTSDSTLPTTLAIAEIGEGGNAEYRFYVTLTSAADVTPESALARIPANVAALHIGTLGLVLEPLAAAVDAVTRAVPSTTLVLLDPNCRPALIDDPTAYRDRLRSLARRADVLKLSDDDIAWLEPGSDPLAAARRMLGDDDGPRVVLVTLGAQGCIVLTRSGVETVAAPPTEVVDTIGAGDAFGGAFVAWWQQRGLPPSALDSHETVLEAARYATRVASLTCARAGAEPPRLADLR